MVKMKCKCKLCNKEFEGRGFDYIQNIVSKHFFIEHKEWVIQKRERQRSAEQELGELEDKYKDITFTLGVRIPLEVEGDNPNVKHLKYNSYAAWEVKDGKLL